MFLQLAELWGQRMITTIYLVEEEVGSFIYRQRWA